MCIRDRHQLGLNGKTFQHGFQVRGLYRAAHHSNALALEVEHGVDGRASGLVQLRPAQQGWCGVKVKDSGAPVGKCHIRHQVNRPGLQRVQAGLPLAGHWHQLPAFLLRDGYQHITQNAAGLAGGRQKQLGGIGINANPDGARRRVKRPRLRPCLLYTSRCV